MFSTEPVAPPSALERWEEIAGRLAGCRPAVFLDFDGTLSPIVERPDAAELPAATRRVLARLAAVAPVAVLSGRDREDVAHRVGLTELIYAGSHGFDIAGPGGLYHRVAGELQPVVAGAAARLQREVEGIPGALVEPKDLTVAIHWRQVPPAFLEELEARVARVVAEHPELEKRDGKKVFEVRPRLDWDKGKALLWLVERLGLDEFDEVGGEGATLLLYLGDDTTDEDAFRALKDRGIGILVAGEARPTAARYRLTDPTEVRRFLERLAESLEARAES